MITILLLAWLLGALLMLAPVVQAVAPTEGSDISKLFIAWAATLLWPFVLIIGALISWKQLLVGK